jgi:glucokinase
MKLLVADIGGTNARFAYQEKNNGELNNFSYLKCNDFENIYDAIEYYQQTNNLDYREYVYCISITYNKRCN